MALRFGEGKHGAARIGRRSRQGGRLAGIALPALLGVLLAGPGTTPAAPVTSIAADAPVVARDAAPAIDPAAGLQAALPRGALSDLVAEVLARNPDLAAEDAAARAAWERPSQAGALPEPMLGVTVFPSAPQTRVGPQQLSLSLSQKLPWFGKQGLRSRSAAAEASGESARLEAARLGLVTETRRLYWELAFLASAEQTVRQDRATLGHYEELSRARYGAGVGLEQAVVKIQAEMTRADARLLDLEARRASLLAQINALRDLPEGAPVAMDSLPGLPRVEPDLPTLRERALAVRPEMAGAEAQVARSRLQVDLARKQYLPDLTLGLAYTFVGRRTDAAGLAMPPEGDGSDIVGISAGINLPLWRGSLAAGVREARQKRIQAEEARRAAAAGIDRSLEDLARRVPLAWDRLRLYQDVLTVQAEQSLRSAESAYAATTIGALDLLDAERVLLEVQIASARARADYAIALAQLEGAVGAPVLPAGAEGESQ